MSAKLPFSIDDIKRSLTTGSIDKAILYNLRGFNHGTRNAYLPKARALQGDCFWVRPQLNLTTDNIRECRLLAPLLNSGGVSTASYVRMMLDPRLEGGFTTPMGGVSNAGKPNASFDNKQAFIPIMTNATRTCTGWPDITVKTWSDKAGVYNQQYTMVDGGTSNSGQIDITASFRNSSGEPILNLIHIWAIYMGLVFEGKVTPYPDFVAQNEIDYQTRIFRLLYDQSGQYVTKIAATGPGVPLAVGIGAGYDYNEALAYNEQNESVDIRFKFHGVEYQDPVLMMEFNNTVDMFNPAMISKSGMTMIPFGLRKYFNHVGYPYINLGNGEFEIWVSEAVVLDVTKRLIRTGMAPEVTKLASPALKKLAMEEGNSERNPVPMAGFPADTGTLT